MIRLITEPHVKLDFDMSRELTEIYDISQIHVIFGHVCVLRFNGHNLPDTIYYNLLQGFFHSIKVLIK